MGQWALDVYFYGTEPDAGELLHILLTLSYKDDGEEFAISYPRLYEIADDLIAEKDNINISRFITPNSCF